MSSSLLLQQCHACLARLIWIVFVMSGRLSYSCCFVECCLQDLFNIEREELLEGIIVYLGIFSVTLNHVTMDQKRVLLDRNDYLKPYNY